MFDWDQHNTAHVARHSVTREEAEEAARDPDRFVIPAYRLGAEKRSGIVGATTAGRLLAVILARRGDRLRVVTARSATDTERRRYRRAKGTRP